MSENHDDVQGARNENRKHTQAAMRRLGLVYTQHNHSIVDKIVRELHSLTLSLLVRRHSEPPAYNHLEHRHKLLLGSEKSRSRHVVREFFQA